MIKTLTPVLALALGLWAGAVQTVAAQDQGPLRITITDGVRCFGGQYCCSKNHVVAYLATHRGCAHQK